ncbi:ribosome maturation factor RimM [Paracrocinitomix mangrovi]|uniref:ribosome maturation factor RimM n=1 Tax=Paracrocinitomix mangrovi TaxID=2862509 RepID=UPI001C8E84E5|nr:ribosome maturation factor RimM [Paracrocinitomix mangrovi]UKN01835.1 ribosome maturation factor RimM [Paracrocinitomix mangrovi]
MFLKEDCFRLGHVSKAHGYKGEVSIFLDVDDPYDYKELESVFIEIDGKLIPFFLEYIRMRNNGYAVVKFELVDTEKQVNLILRKDLFLPLEVLPETEGNQFYYFEIEGYTVVDKEHGEIGTVLGIIDLSGNPIIQIDADGKEILIPKQDEFIEEVDRENQILHISAPPGLIEMYLE